jgi:hypothetical protein
MGEYGEVPMLDFAASLPGAGPRPGQMQPVCRRRDGKPRVHCVSGEDAAMSSVMFRRVGVHCGVLHGAQRTE